MLLAGFFTASRILFGRHLEAESKPNPIYNTSYFELYAIAKILLAFKCD
jgi:hypothetical protein